MRDDLPIEVTHEIRDRCLCLYLQRASRAIGRRFDNAFRHLNVSHGQYSLLVSLNRPNAPRLSAVANILAMDRTTLTANLKPLERRGLLKVTIDPDDKRGKLLHLTDKGRDLLLKAVPIWRMEHDRIDKLLHDPKGDTLRSDLMSIAFLTEKNNP